MRGHLDSEQEESETDIEGESSKHMGKANKRRPPKKPPKKGWDTRNKEGEAGFLKQKKKK